MAQILENKKGRRSIRLSTDDILNIVREYQNAACGLNSAKDIRNKLDDIILYLPEEIYHF